MLNKTVFSFFFSICCLNLVWGQITFDNSKPKLDDKGQPVDAHDGRVMKFGNKYYWYGTAYGNTNGFTPANDYVVYSSKNMNNWHFEGKLIPNKPAGVYYRPNVVYNAKTKKYILWYNWNPKLWDGQFGVATSDTPIGPFIIENDNVTVVNSKYGVGDLGVFVDQDQKAYISYCTIKDHMVSVELLDEKYTASTLKGSEIVAKHCEAGAMFKRNNLYYLLTDYTCCFCTEGSGAQVFTSKNPLGPYTFRQNINRYKGELSAVLTNGIINENFHEKMNDSESLEMDFGKNTNVNQLKISQFTSNRKGQCGEVDNPILHDAIPNPSFEIEYFKDGEWEKINFTTQKQENLAINNYILNFEKPIIAEIIKITPKNIFPNKPLLLTEVSIINTKPIIYKITNGYGRPIIAAQQTFVMPLGQSFIWMGDLWGSASDGIKGHDYQYWSAPLQFYSNGLIKPLIWKNSITITK